ncbi:MAG: class I SAM-dependent methyltransferase [Acidiferrobacterales bacterium]
MSCCMCKGFETEFSHKRASKDLRRYRQKGPRRTTRILLDVLRNQGTEELSLLDIGGGVGAIQHELLSAGVNDVINVEASPAYLEAAKKEIKQQGHASRAKFFLGDFVELAPDIPPADIVTLDRVVCCYEDFQQLVRLSSARTNRFYGLVYPRNGWWVALVIWLENFYHWLTRSPFRAFSHPTEAVEAVVLNSGLRQLFYYKTFVWQVVLYSRGQ